jgi:hypothetical protein
MDIDLQMLRTLFRQAVADEKPDCTPLFQMWFRQRILATLVAGIVLGEDWFERNLADEKRPAYFQTDLSNEDTFIRFNIRVISLGEMILNLFNIENFETRMNETRSDKQSIETKISELVAAKLFKRLGIDFKFRLAVGQKQSDYDIDYVRTDGKLSRCEVKSKLQGTEFSEKTIRDTLKAAKSQLPKGETGILLLRVPEEWVPFNNGVAKLQAIIDAIGEWIKSEKTTRVSSILYVDSRIDVVDSIVYPHIAYKEYKNPFCDDVSGLPALDYEATRRNWLSISDLVQQWLT